MIIFFITIIVIRTVINFRYKTNYNQWFHYLILLTFDYYLLLIWYTDQRSKSAQDNTDFHRGIHHLSTSMQFNGVFLSVRRTSEKERRGGNILIDIRPSQ